MHKNKVNFKCLVCIQEFFKILPNFALIFLLNKPKMVPNASRSTAKKFLLFRPFNFSSSVGAQMDLRVRTCQNVILKNGWKFIFHEKLAKLIKSYNVQNKTDIGCLIRHGELLVATFHSCCWTKRVPGDVL